MRTHELAKALEGLAKILKAMDNVALDELSALPTRRRPDSSEIPLALSTLVGLADIDKTQWVSFINANKFPIQVRPRDASRDVVGKLLRYLEQSPEARKKIKSVAENTRSHTSPELQKALDFLLKT